MSGERWPGQTTYADLIEGYADAFGVPPAFGYGIIAQESGFNPNATRQEPAVYCAATGQTGDASYGLMQVLYCTALGLGYTGSPLGLLDPDTNVQLGMQLLGALLATHDQDEAAAASAYNGGDRPALGYGAPRPDGTFANQSYVDNVLNNTAYFTSYLAARDAGTASDGTFALADDSGADGGSVPIGVAGMIALGAAVALWRRRYARRTGRVF